MADSGALHLKNDWTNLRKRFESKSFRSKTVILISGGLIIYYLKNWIFSRIKARKMKKIGEKTLKLKLSSNFPIIPIPEDKKSEILKLKAFEIVEAIQAKKFTPSEVLYTYIERAEYYGRKWNLSAQEPFQDAVSRLLSLKNGLLSGVPISIKDEIFQETCSSSGGLIWLSQNVDPHDSILVKLLRQEGGVPFIRGNAMQIMMWFETTNNLYGKAHNPWDPLRTTGGSSGGDGGLVAARAAPLAIGSDIAGSIRIPSAFCGIYGFKPSSKRITSAECVGTHPFTVEPLENLVKASYGPIGRCVEDLALVLKSWWHNQLWKNDNMVIPLNFNTDKYNDTKKLKIGYFDNNQVFECAGVIKSIVKDTVERLKSDGHELVELSTDFFPEATELFIRATFAIDNEYLIEELQGEDPEWPYLLGYYKAKLPFVPFFHRLYEWIKGYKQLSHLLSYAKPLSYKEFCELAREIASFKLKYNEYWESLDLDVVVCPIWPLVAPLHGTTVRIAPAFSYAFFWNLLDYPAGVVPVRTVLDGENNYESQKKDRSVNIASKIMENSVGLPVSIQVVGNCYEDEKVLRVMKIIEGYYQFYQSPLDR